MPIKEAPRCFVYVLESDVDGTRYVGITRRLRRRIWEHNRGFCLSTKARAPWVLVYREGCADHEAARKQEMFLKTGEGRRWLRSELSGGLPVKDASG